MTWPRALPWIVLLLLAGLVLGDVRVPRWLGGGGGERAIAAGGTRERAAGARDRRRHDRRARRRARRARALHRRSTRPRRSSRTRRCSASDRRRTSSTRACSAPPARALTLRFDRELRDRYGRLLAYVYRARDGLFVNARLIAAGAARTLAIAPNTADAARSSARLQAGARATRRAGPVERLLGFPAPMKMRQSLAQLEQAFFEETRRIAPGASACGETAVQRSRQRQLERVHKHGSWRFAFLVLSIVVTAVVVTIAMFETLYYVMG